MYHGYTYARSKRGSSEACFNSNALADHIAGTDCVFDWEAAKIPFHVICLGYRSSVIVL